MPKAQIPYDYFTEYILRTPILDLNFYGELTSKAIVTQEQYANAFNNPLIKEAIFLASPELYSELHKWFSEKSEAAPDNRLLLAFLKYLSRMSTRCTPFGLFSGCALGHFGEETLIKMTPPSMNYRHTRLDMNYLVGLAQHLCKSQELKEKLMYFPNSSIYPSGDDLRYIEYEFKNNLRHYKIVEVEASYALRKVIEISKQGATKNKISERLESEGVDSEEALNFVEVLIQSQILVNELEPVVSGPLFSSQIQKVIEKNGAHRAGNLVLLKEIHQSISDIDRSLDNAPASYQAVTYKLEKLNPQFEKKYLFQTDLEIRPKENRLSRRLAENIKHGLILLNKISTASAKDNLDRFKDSFLRRYESAEVPLYEALDVETGIGYLQGINPGDVNPLVDDIVLPDLGFGVPETPLPLSKAQRILYSKLYASNPQRKKITLHAEDFSEIPIRWDDLPDTMSSMVEIIQTSEGQKIRFGGVGGATAAHLIGRFCHSDPKIHAFAKRISQMEKEMNPDDILAEIAHLPEARLGNILQRPSLHEFEIVYLAHSTMAHEKKIGIDDLLISVRNNRLVLRSKRLGRRVIPRLSNAHNFSFNALPIYQFLCDMQTSGIRGGMSFGFGPMEEHFGFLPRVEFENIILHTARWKITEQDISTLVAHSNKLKLFEKEISRLRAHFGLPKFVLLLEGDNQLLINFSNLTSVFMLLDAVKGRPLFWLSEFLFFDEGQESTSICETYANEFVISFYNKNKLQDAK